MKNKSKIFSVIFVVFSLLTGCTKSAPESVPDVQTTIVSEIQTSTETVAETPQIVHAIPITETIQSPEIQAAPETAPEIQEDSEIIQFPETSLTSGIAAEVEDALSPVAEQGADYSVAVISLEQENKNFQFSNCDPKMISASLIKLYVAGTVYENYDMVQAQEAWADETIHLLDIMISESDNDACNTLVTRLGNGDPDEGMNLINAFCQAHGFYDSQINRLMLVSNGKENYTTTADCCNFLKACYQNTLEGSQQIIGFMKNQTLRSKIPAGIPDDTIVANKTGSLSHVENDAAIVYAESGVYFMCVITNNLSDSAEARKAIAKASEIVYQSMQ